MLHRGIGLASAAYRYNLSSKNQTSFRRETRLMALSQRLEFRQSQALVMTPQLMQAIKLLQLSNLDLTAYVEDELEKNPLLERASDDEGPIASADADQTEVSVGSGPEGDAAQEWLGEDLAISRNAIEDDLGTRLDNVFPEDGTVIPTARAEDASAAQSEWASVGSGGREDGEYNLESFVSAERTLADHLAEQLSLSVS